MTSPRRSGFTLIELLVVILIIGILVSLTLPVIHITIQRTERAQAFSQIEQLRIALAEYLADQRRYPRRSGYTTPDELLRNDAPALWAAVFNHASPALGGGQSAPYLESWDEVGVMVDLSQLDADTMSKDGQSGVRRLDADERARAQTVAYQQLHHPGSAEPLVVLDPWGNPFAYREWAGVRAGAKQGLVGTPVPRSGFSQPLNAGGDPPVVGPVEDKPHNLSGVDLWSFGPNGINEYGAGDDVASWHGR